MVETARAKVAAGATLNEVTARVPTTLAPICEKPFLRRRGLPSVAPGILGHIRRTYAMVS